MIMYDFACQNEECLKYRKAEEQLVKSDAKPRCACCGKQLVKQISTTNFKITGGGVYSPGYHTK